MPSLLSWPEDTVHILYAREATGTLSRCRGSFLGLLPAGQRFEDADSSVRHSPFAIDRHHPVGPWSTHHTVPVGTGDCKTYITPIPALAMVSQKYNRILVESGTKPPAPPPISFRLYDVPLPLLQVRQHSNGQIAAGILCMRIQSARPARCDVHECRQLHLSIMPLKPLSMTKT